MTLASTQSISIYLVITIIHLLYLLYWERGSQMKFKIIKVSFWKCVAVLASAKIQYIKKNINVNSNLSTFHILKIVLLRSWIRKILPFLNREKKYAQKCADVSDLVISMDVFLQISHKNEPNSILTTFNDNV